MKLRERSENVHFQGGLPLGVDTALHTRTQDGQPRDGWDNPMLPPPPSHTTGNPRKSVKQRRGTAF